jgi:hypothetical protein
MEERDQKRGGSEQQQKNEYGFWVVLALFASWSFSSLSSAGRLRLRVDWKGSSPVEKREDAQEREEKRREGK